jgi:hypothetical protein
MGNPITLEGGLSADVKPIPETIRIFDVQCLQQEILMITHDRFDCVPAPLQIKNGVKHSLAVRTTVDKITQQVEGVIPVQFDHSEEQLPEGTEATVNVANGK